MASYLDKSGLTTLWSKIKNSFLPLGGGTITGDLTLPTGNLSVGGKISGIFVSSATPTYGLNGLQYFNASLPTSDTADGTISYAPTADWWHILRMNHGNGNGYYIDIGACFHQDYLAYRRVASGTDSGWFRILDEKSGLMKSGDTMTGELALLGNRYTYGTDGKCGLNANNSDIAKVNAIYFADASDSIGEGINFWRTESTWDNMTASNGTFYFGSNVSANATLVGNAYLRAAQYTATDANGFRHAYGDTGYGVFTRNDTSHFYLMLTNQGDPFGSWNSLRPLAIKLSDGSISFGTACTFGSSLTASTVSIWNSSHAPLTIGRSGSTYYASIKFANSLGTLGYLGMTSVNGSLARLSADANTIYKLAEVRGWDGSTLTLGTD